MPAAFDRPMRRHYRMYDCWSTEYRQIVLVGGVAHAVTALVSANEVKQHPPQLVHGWVTVREYRSL
jgi:hypothetical protein